MTYKTIYDIGTIHFNLRANIFYIVLSSISATQKSVIVINENTIKLELSWPIFHSDVFLC